MEGLLRCKGGDRRHGVPWGLDWVGLGLFVFGMDLKDVKELILGRRSLKPALMDAERVVSDELFGELFECANWAPSHGHTEPWRFKVFRGDSRVDFGKGLQRSYLAETDEGVLRKEKFAKLGANPLLAYAVIAVCMQRDPAGKIPEVEEIEAVGCAVQNLHLAAQSVGLGVFWSSPAVSYGKTFGKFLGLGEGERCLGMLYIGWPKEGLEWPKSARRDWREKVSFLG